MDAKVCGIPVSAHLSVARKIACYLEILKSWYSTSPISAAALKVRPITRHPGFFPPHNALAEYSRSPEVECMHDDKTQVHLIHVAGSCQWGYCTFWGVRIPTLADVHALHLQLGSIIRRVNFVSWITTCCECQKKNQRTAFIVNESVQTHKPWIFSTTEQLPPPSRKAGKSKHNVTRELRFRLVIVFRLLGTQTLVWRYLRLDMVPFGGQHAGERWMEVWYGLSEIGKWDDVPIVNTRNLLWRPGNKTRGCARCARGEVRLQCLSVVSPGSGTRSR